MLCIIGHSNNTVDGGYEKAEIEDCCNQSSDAPMMHTTLLGIILTCMIHLNGLFQC